MLITTSSLVLSCTYLSQRKTMELSAKITRDAATERSIGERRLSASLLRGQLNHSLLEARMEQVRQLDEVRRNKSPVRRRSVMSKGFPGTHVPGGEAEIDKARTPKQRKEEKMKYSQSLSEIKTLFEERKQMKRHLSTSEINVGSTDVLSDSGESSDFSPLHLRSPSGGDGIGAGTGFSSGPPSPTFGSSLLSGRPFSRSSSLPQNMASASRIYGSPSSRGVPKVEVPFGSARGRETPVSILREIRSPPRQLFSKKDRASLLSSPSPWG